MDRHSIVGPHSRDFGIILYLRFSLSFDAASSPPLNVMAVNVSVVKIQFSWNPPANPNGIITAYRVSLSMGMFNSGHASLLIIIGLM